MMISLMKNGQPEIYPAIQGEGKTLGYPVIFVRFALCNLHCKWCDTAYTWHFKDCPFDHEYEPKFNKENVMKEMIVQEVVDKIKEVSKGKIKRIVFTGGEPMLFQKDIIKILDELDDYNVEIETNGTILPIKDFTRYIDQINCSPKLSNSGNDFLNNEAIKELNLPKTIFKFVVSDINDILEVEEFQKENNILDDQIYLMPQGVNSKESILKTESLVDYCIESNWKLSPRLHIILYGAKQGV